MESFFLATKRISFIQRAGGVGKTTLVHNIGYHLASEGKRVLLVDMDYQGSLTAFCGIEDIRDLTIREALETGQPCPVVHSEYGFDLLPANRRLVDIDHLLTDVVGGGGKLDALLKHYPGYEYILIDPNPGSVGLFTNSLFASDFVIIPVMTEFKAVRATADMVKDVVRLQKGRRTNLRIAGFVPTMYHARRIHDQEALEEIEGFERLRLGKVFTPIPEASVFPRASFHHQPVLVFDRRAKVNGPLQLLTQEIVQSISGVTV